MTVKDLKEWIKILPLEFDDNELVYRKLIIDEKEDSDIWAVKDMIISSCGIDEEHKEAWLCNYDTYKQMVKYDENKKNKEK